MHLRNVWCDITRKLIASRRWCPNIRCYVLLTVGFQPEKSVIIRDSDECICESKVQICEGNNPRHPCNPSNPRFRQQTPNTNLTLPVTPTPHLNVSLENEIVLCYIHSTP